MTTAPNDDQARELLHQFGLPFRQPAKAREARQAADPDRDQTEYDPVGDRSLFFEG